MNIVTAAAICYGVVVAYLFLRGVAARKVLMIAAAGIGGGLLLAYTLGIAYFLIVLLKPAETIAVFSMVMVVFSAAYFAREEILGRRLAADVSRGSSRSAMPKARA